MTIIAINQRSLINVIARNSYPPLAGMGDVAISWLLSLRQPYRNKPRDCHAPKCDEGASLRSQRRLRSITVVSGLGLRFTEGCDLTPYCRKKQKQPKKTNRTHFAVNA